MTASKYRVKLTESQRLRLSEVANRGRSPARTVKRALALLKTDEGLTDDRIADALSIGRRTGQKRKLDDRAEAHLVAIA